eukprot:12036459-Ditylum_brightwellii.AAC.1
MEGSTYATLLDFDMGYYNIEIPQACILCVTLFCSVGKYEYIKLPMGLCNSPDISQEKIT